MKKLLSLIGVIGLASCTTTTELVPANTAPSCDDIWTINSITAQDGRADEAKRYYEAAWLPARVVAKRTGVIKDYRLLSSEKPDQPGFQLVTMYEDDAQFAASEDAFQSIFRALKLPRPLLIDGLGRDAIIANTDGADDYRFVRSSAGPC